MPQIVVIELGFEDDEDAEQFKVEFESAELPFDRMIRNPDDVIEIRVETP